MDPNATLQQMANAFRDDDADMALERRADLIAWIKCGGFWPDRIYGNPVAPDRVSAWLDMVGTLACN